MPTANETVVIKLQGRLDSISSPDFEDTLKSHLQAPSHHLLLDFEALDYISSDGLRVVLNITKIFDQSPWQFAVCRMQDHVQEIFEISGFDGFITIYHSADDFFDTSE